MGNRPIVIFICLHFWKKEWWHSRWCHECTNWIRALISGKSEEVRNGD